VFMIPLGVEKVIRGKEGQEFLWFILQEDGRYVWTRFHFLSVTRRCLRTEVSKDGQFFDVQIAVPPGLSQEDIEGVLTVNSDCHF
jgi:hypothetical protein